MCENPRVHAFRLVGTVTHEFDGMSFRRKVYELVAEHDEYNISKTLSEPVPRDWLDEQSFWPADGQVRDEWILVDSEAIHTETQEFPRPDVATNLEAQGILNILNMLNLERSDPTQVFPPPARQASSAMAGPDVITDLLTQLHTWWKASGGRYAGDYPEVDVIKVEALRWLYRFPLMWSPPTPPTTLKLDTSDRT